MGRSVFTDNLFIRYSKLNEDQIKAITQVYGPVLVIAGPGSGKTTVISYRIHNLVKNHKVNPDNIILLTFTNKAAQEMNKRIKNLFNIELPYAGTFHSIILKLLKEYIQRNYTIESINFDYVNTKLNLIDEEDKIEIIKTIVKVYKFDKKFKINVFDIANFISAIKNKKVESFNGIYGEVFCIYNDILRKQNLIDFDDLLILGIDLFNNEKILKDLKTKFNFLMVDEYQDINYLQFEFLRRFAIDNIFVVGDDDQNIYSFRNSDVRFILEFPNYYKNATIIKLRYNYRSYQEIIDFATNIVSYVSYRYPKDLIAFKGNRSETVIYKFFANENQEDEFIVNELKDLFSKNSSVVVLCRTNEVVKYIEKLLISNSIPVKAIGSYNFFNRKEVKDIIALFKISINLNDDLSLVRVFKNFFNLRKIDKIYSECLELGKNIYDYLELNYFKVDSNILEVFYFIKNFVDKILNYQAISDWVIDFIDSVNLNFSFDYFSKNKREYVELFLKFVSSFEKRKKSNNYNYNNDNNDKQMDYFEFLKDLINYVLLIRGNDIEVEEIEKVNKVIVMTIHSAKGLEFDCVFIPKVKEGLLPHYKSENIEEECRLFYVAATRAKEKLIITSCNPISRFLLNFITQKEMKKL